MESKGYSQRRACKLLGMNRATCRYQSVLENDNQEVCELLMRLSESHKRWGFGLMFKWLRRQGYS